MEDNADNNLNSKTPQETVEQIYELFLKATKVRYNGFGRKIREVPLI